MEEEEYSTESSNEEDMQEDGEREGNAAESDVFKPVDVDPACFGITRRSNNTFDGFRYRSTFICSKGGQSRLRSGVTRPARKRNMKTGCKAKMIVKDAHFQNRWEQVLLGCGLLAGRYLGAYVWLFGTRLRCMNAKPPHSIITNYCHDVAIAIKKVFPNARHRFCLSHILNELPEKLEEMENKDEIISTFTTLACDYVRNDFDREWQGTSLKMFVEKYEEAVKGKLEKEYYEDLRSAQMRPPMMTADRVACGRSSSKVVTYIVSEHVDQTNKVDYKVAYDNVQGDIWCLCRLFQSKGILSRHALTVLRQDLVLMIPQKYIIHRWCKDCKQTCASISQPVSAGNQELGSYDDLYKLGHQYFAEGWDLTQGQSKRSRKKKLATPTVLDTLKKKTRREYNKGRNATANTLNTAVTATDSVTDGTNVETISFDLSQYNNAPSFHWPESSSRSQLQFDLSIPAWDSGSQ
ncbi:unnamed protein product [Miscanthus lutarioriparius]|uniref:Protein FAR1-RELATED SEQUENCE n=1 Tax=Miscanthus lutarioriparius TaxID=422564 RepID=A0A811NFM8_9POAL|nr:unnamed protein product [Miscanthus lutarioriparius]